MDAGHSRFEMNWWVTAGNGDQVCDLDGLNRSHNEDVARDDGAADAEFIANAPDDIAYLLTELRKAHDALARVEALHQPVDAAMYAGNGVHKVKVCTGCGTDDGNWQRWPCPTRAAVTAAKGDGE
jgi:hypothetical protein